MLSEIQIKEQIVKMKVEEEFLRFGFDFYKAPGDNNLYDYIVDTGMETLKIKVVRSFGTEDGNCSFSCTYRDYAGAEKIYTQDDIDYFATVWKSKVYFVHVAETNGTKVLRFTNDVDDCYRYLSGNIFGCFERLDNYSLYPTGAEKDICADCGDLIAKDENYCIKCVNKSMSYHKPTRDELKGIIRSMSFIDVAKKYGVTDSMIRKWFAEYGLPTSRLKISSYTDEEWAEV